MKITKATQIYVSIVSVFLLAIVTSATYITQSGGINSQADTVVTKPTPTLSITTDKKIYQTNDLVVVKINESNSIPITAGQILFSYPTKSLQVVSISDSGILGQAQNVVRNDDAGVISLTYEPLVGYGGSGGALAEITLRAIKNDKINLVLEGESQLPNSLPTAITTIEKKVLPKIKNAAIEVR
jgi:hypothetical protein